MPIKILLIDDDARVLQSFARNVRVAGYTVLTAADGQAGLELYHQEQPDIVLTDLRMPGLDGLGVLRAIRQHDPEANVILVSGHGDQDAILEALRAGAADFLPKPVDQVSLESALRRAAERAHLTRELRASQEALRQQNAQLEAEVAARTAALQERERDLIQAQRVAHVGSWQIDLATGRVTSSEEARRIYGVSGDEWTLPVVQSIPLPEYRELLNAALHNLIEQGSPYDVEFRIRRPGDGEIRAIHSVAEYDPERRRILGVLQDITAQKQAAEALRMQSLVLDQIQDLVTVTDLDGVITYVNQAEVNTTGQTREELIGQPTDIYGEDAERSTTQGEIVAQTLQHGAWRGEVINFAADGSERVMDCRTQVVHDEHGNPVALCGISTDITVRKQMEVALRESEARFHSYIECAPYGLFIADAQGRYLEVNPAACAITGYTEAELLTMRVPDLLPPQAQADGKAHFQQVMETGRAFGEVLPFKHQSGELRYWTVDAVRLSPTCLMGYVQDVTVRKQAEEALRVSEVKYRSLYEEAAIGIFHSTFEGRFLDVNPALAQMLGYASPQEVVDAIHNIAEQVYAIPPHRDEIITRALSAGQAIKVENRYRRRNGEVWDAHLHLRYVMDQQGQPMYLEGFVEDISERKQAEAALRESKERFEKTFNNQLDAIFLLDAQPVPLIIDCNPAAARVFGYTRDEMLGRTTAFLHADVATLREFQEQLYPAIAEQGYLYLREFQMKRKNGAVFFTEHSVIPLEGEAGDRIGWVSIVRDITARKQMEATLRESEARFASLFEEAPLGYQSLDENGNFLMVNDAWLNTLGYQREEVLGRWFGEFLAPEYVEAFRQRFPRFKAAGRIQTEFVMLHRNGERRYIAFEGRIGYQADQRFERTHCILQDITERKLIEEALRESEERFRTLFEATTEGIVLHEIVCAETGEALDYRILDANPAFERHTGLPLTAIRGQQFPEVVL